MSKHSIAIGSSVLLLLLCAIGIVASPRHADTLTLSGTTPMPFILHHGDFVEWTGGDFVEIEDRFSDSPTLTTFDRDGKELSRFIFTIPGAGSIHIYDNSVAVGKDGSLAIIGTAPSNDSSGATFVALVSPDRRHQTLIRPTSFVAEAVTMPSDGTIWVSGYKKKTQPSERLNNNQAVVLRYDRSGNLLGSVFPLSNAKPDSGNARLGRAPSILVSFGDRVGWYFRTAQAQAYIEFSLDGSPVDRFKGPQQQIGDVVTVAACTNGDVFAATTIHGTDGKNWGIFSLNREHSDWTLIPREEKWGHLLGCDGTHLVAYTDFNNISWLETAAH